MAKKLNTAFVSPLGRHTSRSLGDNLGFSQLHRNVKNLQKGDPQTSLNNLGRIVENTDKIVAGLKIGRTILGTVLNGAASPSHTGKERIPLIATSSQSELGTTNVSYFHKVKAHIGKRSSSKMNQLRNGPFIYRDLKKLSGTQNDYLDDKHRKELLIKKKFNQKTFTFFLEDTFLRIYDLESLIRIENRFGKMLKDTHKEVKDIYAGIE